jgi:PAS domain S-box-containing protein
LRAEEAHAYLASIVESSDDAIIGRSMEGIIQSWNRGAERLYGYTAQEAIGQPITMVIPPDRAQEFVSSDRLKRGEPIQELETVRVGKDGGRIDVSVIISPMKDAAGRVFGAATIARDITERKRAEEALRQSEAYLAEGQRLSHTGSWAFDLASNKYIYVSEENFRIFEMDAQEGLPNREVISRHIHPEDWDRVNDSRSGGGVRRTPGVKWAQPGRRAGGDNGAAGRERRGKEHSVATHHWPGTPAIGQHLGERG